MTSTMRAAVLDSPDPAISPTISDVPVPVPAGGWP